MKLLFPSSIIDLKSIGCISIIFKVAGTHRDSLLIDRTGLACVAGLDCSVFQIRYNISGASPGSQPASSGPAWPPHKVTET